MGWVFDFFVSVKCFRIKKQYIPLIKPSVAEKCLPRKRKVKKTGWGLGIMLKGFY